MKPRIAARIALLLIGCLFLPFGAQARPATQAESDRFVGAASFKGQRIPAAELSQAIQNRLSTQRNGSTRVVIELKDDPAVKTYAEAQASTQSAAGQAVVNARAQLARIEQAQQRVLTALTGLNALVLYRTQRVYNGIAVQIDASKLVNVAKLADVKAIHPLIPSRLANSTSVPFIGAPELWNQSLDGVHVTGKGLRIGIIDTGVDYIHTDFGGSGAEADYTRNLTTTIDEQPPLFPSAKVVGGYDFVGDTYDALSSDPAKLTPQPDPDPVDCNGHGTHVAGTAAGFGVKGNGTTFTGPYRSSTNLDALRIGPGVAPEALIYALKVFGCEGSSDIIAPAIEFAVDPNNDGNFSDHLDVINMSLGNSAGSVNDPQAVASDNAALAGVIVAAAAGNDNDAYYITGAPAAAKRAISVAASVDNGLVFLGIRVNSPDSVKGVYQAAAATFGPQLSETGVTGNITYAEPRNGCSPLTNATAISGTVALVDRGTCTFVTKVRNAQQAGATAVIIVNNRPGEPAAPGGDGTEADITIPSVMISQSDGAKIKAALASSAVNVTLSSGVTFPRPDLADTLASFSSRGPAQPGSGLKPDIAAPGLSITSAKIDSGNAPLTISGTSMATPHIAGVMTLLRQLHPNWTVEELKALAMNTATHDVRTAAAEDAQVFGPGRIGAGRVDVAKAADDQVIAYNADDPGAVSVSFGNLEVTDVVTSGADITATHTIRVVNKGAATRKYDLAYAPIATIPGLAYSFSPSSLTLGSNVTETVTLTLTADAALLKHTHDPSITEVQNGLPRHWLSEAAGHLTLTAPAPSRSFKASIHGFYENPPVDSPVSGTGVFTYTDGANKLEYNITFSQAITLTDVGGHIHRGPAGINGPIAYPLTGAGTFTALKGSVTISDTDEALLLNGGLYVNFHTQDNPTGEIRGQIVPATPDLRVPIHAAARPASTMRAATGNVNFDGAPDSTVSIGLTGQGLSGTNVPVDEQSLVTAFELQHTSADEPGAQGNNADLRYVGVASAADPTIKNPTGVISETEIYFGIATHGERASPHQVEFDILIDTNRDNKADFLLFESSLGALLGSGPDDVFLTALVDLNNPSAGATLQDYVNVVPAASDGVLPGLDTVPFNTNAIVLPVLARSLGLNASNASFAYQIVSYSTDRGEFIDDAVAYGDPFDQTPPLTYDAGKPGLTFLDTLIGPAYTDVPGTSIKVRLNAAAYLAAKSQGILLLHHHNAAGARAEIVTVQFTPPGPGPGPSGRRIALPLIAKK